MRSDTTSETERRPTDTNAQVGETETRPTNTNAEVREVGDTETRLTDTNVEVGEVGETETRPTDTNVEVGEVGETETQPRDAKAEVGDTETRLMDTNVEGEVGETETQPTVTNAEVGETETQPTGTNAEVGEVGDTERRPDLVWDAEAPGLCVRIYGDGSKSFIFVYCLNDRQHFIRIGTTPVWSLEAARNRAKKLRSILNGTTNKILSRPSRTSSDTLPSNCKIVTLSLPRSISRLALKKVWRNAGLPHFLPEDDLWNRPPQYPAAKLLTRNEARRIAANVAKLPELLRKSD